MHGTLKVASFAGGMGLDEAGKWKDTCAIEKPIPLYHVSTMGVHKASMVDEEILETGELYHGVLCKIVEESSR